MAPLVGRGVLLDVAGKRRLDPDYAITSAVPERAVQNAGVREGGSRWLVERKVKAAGADNMAFDVMGPADPELKVTLPGHILLLVRAGIPIIENLNLEELAAAKLHEFLFVCLPLKMRGATGSPVRPIAIS